MGTKWSHRLSEKNLVTKTAICSVCGPVRIRVRKTRSPVCLNKHKESKKYYPQHQKKQVLTKMQVINTAKSVPCMDCGVSYPPYVMDFDHRDPSLKTTNVSRMKTRSIELIQEEIAKCDVVCANCHRERTHGKRKAS